MAGSSSFFLSLGGHGRCLRWSYHRQERENVPVMTRSSTRRTTIGLLFAVLLLLAYRGSGVNRLEGRILDGKTGQPVAATLLLSDGEEDRSRWTVSIPTFSTWVNADATWTAPLY